MLQLDFSVPFSTTDLYINIPDTSTLSHVIVLPIHDLYSTKVLEELGYMDKDILGKVGS